MSKAGAPTKYKDAYAEQSRKLTLLGYTDEELAAFYDIHVDTIYEWKKKHSEFSEAVMEGKSIADANVAAAFYKRATGYTYTEVKTHSKGDGKSKEIIKTITEEKEVVPDAGAALNWLKNRQPDKWRDKQEVEHNITNIEITKTILGAKDS